MQNARMLLYVWHFVYVSWSLIFNRCQQCSVRVKSNYNSNPAMLTKSRPRPRYWRPTPRPNFSRLTCSHKDWKNGPSVWTSTWVQDREKRQGQSKKSQSSYISHLWGEAPTVPSETKICMVGKHPDVVTRAKFQHEIFRGYDFTGGQIFHFPTDFCMGLTTVQRYCTACDHLY